MDPEDQTLHACNIGKFEHSQCHLTTYCSHKGLKPVKDFSPEEQLLLNRRSGVSLNAEDNVCFHHQALLLERFEFLQRSCCNPFNKKNHSNRKGLRPINLETAEQLKDMTQKDVKPGQKLCPLCRREFYTRKAVVCSKSSGSHSDEEDKTNATETLNASLTAVGISPLKFQRLAARDSKGYAKRKISETQEVIIEKIATASGLNPEDLVPSTSKQCTDCLDYKQMLNELKEKLHVSKRQEQIQILTMAPQSWTIKQVMQEFGVSEKMVKTARTLKNDVGILALPKSKCGKKLPEDVKQTVIEFFQDPEFSRICPGRKDCVSVRIDGKKVQVQKYLLLNNLKEMYTAFKCQNGPKVGFSKFCELRPKWCVTVGAAGTHSVCVCTIHQNVKLMLASSPICENYKELLKITVCDIESKDCMLHHCEACPGEKALKDYLDKVFEECDLDDEIEFKQWVHTDRDTLETKQKPIEDFAEELVSKISVLSAHHFIAKHQSKHLKQIKEELKPGELIILMDFAENYAFVVQDAAQGFHWENSQATLHPFVIYFKDDCEIKHISYCIISDCLKHDTVAVHAFLVQLIASLKAKLTEIVHIHYFSDGSAAQYKNFKNFLNLCCHKKDFGIKAEWNFFGTSHGKSPCDGIGGTVKRLAARASLQRPIENQILTPSDLYGFCTQNISGIEFIYVTREEVEQLRIAQEERFRSGCTVAGTRENHHFEPINEKEIRVRRVSNDGAVFTAVVDKSARFECHQDDIITTSNLQVGQYVACVYDNKWWIGNICEISTEENDTLITFMHPQGPAQSFYWPERRDVCWVPEQHILATVPVPTATAMGRQYHLTEATVAVINNKFYALNQ